ncbi:class I SAM-dependent methyltransferase [Salinisphaera sp. PC39]|uniref:class I SAM-dependent methyltransferase n=1 Tax=Salinisphaera sp. PC39 TaxID=1304156 RepID=UPI003340B396
MRESLYRVLAEAVTAGGRVEGRVLDVGCGRGEVMAALTDAGFRMVGVDPEAECVEASAHHAEAHQGGVEDIAAMFGDETFSAVICSHVLEHLRDPHGALCHMRRINANRYVFAVPNILRPARIVRAVLGKRRGDHPHHLFGWGHAEFERLLRDCGFRVVAWHQDRVTFMPLGGRLGAFLGRWLRSLEERFLVRVFPVLSSSLIVACVRDDLEHGQEGV